MKINNWLRSVLRLDEPRPILKHTPTFVLFFTAVLVTLYVPGIEVTNEVAFQISVLWMLVSVSIAVVTTYSTTLARFAIAVPLIDFVAIGALREGTGGSTSVFTSLIILPVLWIASEKGRRFVILAMVGTSLSILIPLTFSYLQGDPPQHWIRGVVVPVVYGVAAAIINEASEVIRRELEQVKQLSAERELMLEAAVTYADRLREDEEKLSAANRLTTSVLDAVVSESVIGTDVTGLIDVWNPGAQAMLGLAPDQTQGKRYVYDFHVQDELDDRSRELNYPPGETVLTPGFSALVESARLGKAEVHDWTYVRADGSELPVEVAVNRRVDEHGKTIGYIFVATDMTQAIEINRLKDEFVGLISHELRTPISSILGYLELMRDDEETPLSDEQLLYLSVAERNAHRLLRLVGDLLFTAQVESSSFTLAAKPIDVGPVVAAAVESAMPSSTASGVSISLETSDPPFIVDADAQRIGQVCDNLISNALKFTPRGGKVTVRVENVGDKVVITFTDTGMGIPEDELDKLFARFFRASTATRAAVPGIGLGLSITKAIVVAHRGELDVESTIGVGTSFIVRLPRSQAALAAVDAPAGLSLAAGAGA